MTATGILAVAVVTMAVRLWIGNGHDGGRSDPGSVPESADDLDVEGSWEVVGGGGANFRLSGSAPDYDYAGFNAVGQLTEDGVATLSDRMIRIEARNVALGVDYVMEFHVKEDELHGTLTLPGGGSQSIRAHRK